MDLKQLLALVTVADLGSVTRAARRLRVAQPAVTRQVRALEHELGVSLFARTSTGMTLTDEGEVMVDRARRALGELERARAELQPAPHDVGGVVCVGLLDSVAGLLAAPLAARLREDFPAVRLRLMTAYSGHLRQWLDDGTLDVALLYDLRGTRTLGVTPLVREALWVIAPPGPGWGSDPVSVSRLADVPLVLPEPGHGLRVLVDRALAAARITPLVHLETNSMAVQKQLVLAGHGWSVLPAAGAATDVGAGRLCGAPLTPPVTRTVAVVVREQARVPMANRAVATTLTGCVRETADTARWPAEVLG